MINGIIAKKIGITSLFTPEGKYIAVTRLQVKPLTVTQVKSATTKDKYVAIQVAGGVKKHLSKATEAKLAKLKLKISPSFFQEFKLYDETAPAVGDQITADAVFTVGETISATGTSKGHGFAGVIKRWGFQRQPVSGGQSDRVRAPGAIGAQTPGKVLKGKKMPGHYGNKTKTVSSLKVYAINTEKQEILITGSVPGSVNSYVILTKRKLLKL
ncbi:MAG: 50S ribosomal protein L3 [Candidatus Shapirobacteria bacterium]|nr:50S ribosomal protein L3 [Candidatus Shapirobacteria bacterium]